MSEIPVTTFRQELKVIAAVLLFLLGLELLARRISSTLDDDRAHIAQFEETVATLGGERQGVVLGNSLLLHGFDEELFARECPEIPLIKVTPVATAILDWGHLFERYFVGSDHLPKNLFVGFVGHHLDDSEPAKLRRLSRHFAESDSLPGLWENEGFDFHQRVQSALAHATALIGDQPAHRERVLDYFIDWYRLGLRTNQKFVTGDLSDGEPGEKTYRRLHRFLDELAGSGVELCLIPMPQPEHWELDPKLQKIIEARSVRVLDARAIPGMAESDFSDGYHLGESGSRKFTRWFAGELTPRPSR